MSNIDSTASYSISQFSDQSPADSLHDIAAMLDYLLEAQTDEGQHYGLTLFLKIARDSLNAVGDRLAVENLSIA